MPNYSRERDCGKVEWNLGMCVLAISKSNNFHKNVPTMVYYPASLLRLYRIDFHQIDPNNPALSQAIVCSVWLKLLVRGCDALEKREVFSRNSVVFIGKDEWVKSRWLSHIKCVHESIFTYKCLKRHIIMSMSHVWMGHGTRTNASGHTHGGVTSHV